MPRKALAAGARDPTSLPHVKDKSLWIMEISQGRSSNTATATMRMYESVESPKGVFAVAEIDDDRSTAIDEDWIKANGIRNPMMVSVAATPIMQSLAPTSDIISTPGTEHILHESTRARLGEHFGPGAHRFMWPAERRGGQQCKVDDATRGEQRGRSSPSVSLWLIFAYIFVTVSSR